ncbi:Sulfate/thiosulfate import ATP-binding protein CysA [Candidatus Calditenuaceae archaeon HR02]|nr:Sulfate/thiosulfate import ATP-binding protein CysA [Candidatus Calditenuaceae archaeon HR02]
MLEVRDLVIVRGDWRLEIGLLKVRSKTVLLGRNGAGKSTLLKAIMGLIRPANGRIIVNGRDISDLAVEDRPLGYVPQRVVRLAMSPRDQLEYFSKLHGTDYRPLISKLGLEPLVGKRNLSLGETQILTIATVLLKNPEALLMDEPCANLDWLNKKQVLNLIRILETPILYVTHDPLEALLVADEIALLEEGRVKGVYPNEARERVQKDLKFYDLYERLKTSGPRIGD